MVELNNKEFLKHGIQNVSNLSEFSNLSSEYKT